MPTGSWAAFSRGTVPGEELRDTRMRKCRVTARSLILYLITRSLHCVV